MIDNNLRPLMPMGTYNIIGLKAAIYGKPWAKELAHLITEECSSFQKILVRKPMIVWNNHEGEDFYTYDWWRIFCILKLFVSMLNKVDERRKSYGLN